MSIIPIIQNVIKSTIRVTDVELKIVELKKTNENIEQMISNLIDMQVKMPSLSDETFNQKYHAYTNQLKANTTETQKLEAEYIANYDTRSRLAKIESTLNQLNEPITEVDSDTLRSFVYRMISVKADEIIFCIAGKKNYIDQEFSEKRH